MTPPPAPFLPLARRRLLPQSKITILFFLLLLVLTSTPCPSYAKSTTASTKTTSSESETLDADGFPAKGGVIELSMRNFSKSLRQGGPHTAWLITFYAPWCAHCQRFDPTYRGIATTLHGRITAKGQAEAKRLAKEAMQDALHRRKQQESGNADDANDDAQYEAEDDAMFDDDDAAAAQTEDTTSSSSTTAPPGKRFVRVARIDGSVERALTSRFGVTGFPAIYLLEGWTVWEYRGARTHDALVKFATETYQDSEPMPFVSSPFGPMGQARALIMNIGVFLLDAHEWLMSYFGFSSTTAATLLAMMAVFGSISIMIPIGLLLVSKDKMD